MAFPRWVFRLAGIYGLLVMTPQYFLEEQINREQPPAITHPEYFYGFVGVAVAWQLAFLVISLDPVRYRLLMLPSIVEKLTFGIAAIVLFNGGRLDATVLGFGCVDLVLAVLFAWSFWLTREKSA